jgi:hypothetical protein
MYMHGCIYEHMYVHSCIYEVYARFFFRYLGGRYVLLDIYIYILIPLSLDNNHLEEGIRIIPKTYYLRDK